MPEIVSTPVAPPAAVPKPPQASHSITKTTLGGRVRPLENATGVTKQATKSVAEPVAKPAATPAAKPSVEPVATAAPAASAEAPAHIWYTYQKPRSLCKTIGKIF